MVESTVPSDGYTGAFKPLRGVALEPCSNLVLTNTGNRRVVAVRDALPQYKTWVPLMVRSGRAE